MRLKLPGLMYCGIVVALLLTTACATTKITSAWKDEAYQKNPHKIMVIAVDKRTGNRRIFEDEFVKELTTRGTDAIAGYKVLPDEKQSNRAVIAAKMKEQGADAVLITRLVKKKIVHTYVPGSAYYPPSYYDTWHDYYGYGSQAMYTPGYMAENEYAVMETNLYDAGNDKLIWSASSESEIRGSDMKLIKSYIRVMVKTMANKKLLR